MDVWRLGFHWAEEFMTLSDAIIKALGDDGAKQFVKDLCKGDQNLKGVNPETDWKQYLENPFNFCEVYGDADILEFFNDNVENYFIDDVSTVNESIYHLVEFKEEIFLKYILDKYPDIVKKEAIETRILARKI